MHGRQRRGVQAWPGPTREIRSGVGSPRGEGRPPLSGGDRRARRSGRMVPSPPAWAGVRVPCGGRSRPAPDRKFAEGVSSIARPTGRPGDPPGLAPSLSIRADLHGPRRTHQSPRGSACEETARLLARSGAGRVVTCSASGRCRRRSAASRASSLRSSPSATLDSAACTAGRVTVADRKEPHPARHA